MSSYISGWYNSVKGMLGYENLEVESGGGAEEKVNNAASEERKGLWKQLSSYLGQDVTSLISLPVWIFEPLSFLQIMCEPLQYADLLHKASETPDSFERMGYLIAFISAGYSCAVRQRKPFNPILGETFEFIPRDKSFKFFAEQVSHHPPIGVATAVCGGFTLLLEMELKTKFKGNSSDVMVDGSNHITFHKFNDKITWGHLSTCAYNVIIGGMWVDHFGTIELKNETTGDKGVLTFTKAGWLGAGRFQMQAQIFDKEGNLRLKLQGAWNDSIYAIKVNNGVEGVPTLIWKHGTIDNTKWNWSKFTTELNVMSDSYKSILPPTDSRVRSDRYYLEKGDLDTAGKEKHKLEEKQRAERREREAKGEAYTPKYFKSVNDATWGHKYDYIGSYWEERAQRISSKGHKAEDFETSFCSPASVNQVSNDLANLEIK